LSRKTGPECPPHHSLQEIIEQLPPEKLSKIRNYPKLATLQSIYQALSSLLESDHSYLSQIAELISRDPPLTSRLLRLANTLIYDDTDSCVDIEEAALAAGFEKIQQLLLAAPIIQDLQQLQRENEHTNWNDFWKHSIATAILSREIFAQRQESCRGDLDYLSGLIHNIGKIIMALTFPEEFDKIALFSPADEYEEIEFEKSLLGLDHAQLGAYYLHINGLPEEIIDATHYHINPWATTRHSILAATTQLSNNLARMAGIHGIENLPIPDWEYIEQLDSWPQLFPNEDLQQHTKEALRPTLESLPFFLQTMV
jgi:HD-like signal output (HDOD) protein